MTKTTTSKRPECLVYMVEDGKGDNPFWTRVGTLWAHEDGEGFNPSSRPCLSRPFDDRRGYVQAADAVLLVALVSEASVEAF